MIFTKRERRIAYFVLGLLGLLVLGFLGLKLMDYRESIATGRTAIENQIKQEKILLGRVPELERAWNTLCNTGLKPNQSEAESQLVHALYDYAPASGLAISSHKLDSAPKVVNEKFIEVSLHATGTGTMGALSKLLWRLETAPFPLHVNSVHITPRKEATDDLSVQLTLSTLCLNPDADKPKTLQPPKEIATP